MEEFIEKDSAINLQNNKDEDILDMLSFLFKLAVFEGSFEALFYFTVMVAMLIGFCLVCGFILLLTIAFFYYYIKFLLRIFEIYG